MDGGGKPWGPVGKGPAPDTEPQNRRTDQPQNRRTAEQTNRGTAEQTNRRTAEQTNRGTAEGRTPTGDQGPADPVRQPVVDSCGSEAKLIAAEDAETPESGAEHAMLQPVMLGASFVLLSVRTLLLWRAFPSASARPCQSPCGCGRHPFVVEPSAPDGRPGRPAMAGRKYVPPDWSASVPRRQSAREPSCFTEAGAPAAGPWNAASPYAAAGMRRSRLPRRPVTARQKRAVFHRRALWGA
jgi:hypothetical protein